MMVAIVCLWLAINLILSASPVLGEGGGDSSPSLLRSTAAAVAATTTQRKLNGSSSKKGKVREYTLEASATYTFFGNGGVEQTLWTFNGMVPGPTLEGNVGDTLVVHFKNNLDMDTTLHWHGFEVPANMDGSPLSQHPVMPGEMYTYEFELVRASTYWYHPHVRSDIMVEMGLYGALIVHDEEISEYLPDNQYVIMLDDVLLEEDGHMAPFLEDLEPAKKAEEYLNGRIGNQLLVNGDYIPMTDLPDSKRKMGKNKYNDKPDLKEGDELRLHFVNTANTRFMRLSFPDQYVYKVATDGGFVQEPRMIQPINMVPHPTDDGKMMSNPDPNLGLLLTPGERAEVVFSVNGPSFKIEWHDFAVGRHRVFVDDDGIKAGHSNPLDGTREPQVFVEWTVKQKTGMPYYMPPTFLVDIDPIMPPNDAEVITYEFGHTAPDRTTGDVFFFGQIIEGTKLPFDDITANQAQEVVAYSEHYIDVANTDGHDHNFHLHGFHFQLVYTQWILADGTTSKIETNRYMEWRDTIWIPRRPEAGGRTIRRLAVQFGKEDEGRNVCAAGKDPTETESGGWLVHCHMFEHGDFGMASFLQVTGCADESE